MFESKADDNDDGDGTVDGRFFAPSLLCFWGTEQSVPLIQRSPSSRNSWKTIFKGAKAMMNCKNSVVIKGSIRRNPKN